MRTLPASLLTALMFMAAAAQADEFFQVNPMAPGSLWVPQLFLEAKPGTDRNIGAFDLTWPLTQQREQLLFLDGRFRYDSNDTLEGNLGLGYRFQFNPDVILGFYGFFDVLQSENKNQFLQLTVGGELLMEDWEARANLYLPEDRTVDLGSTYGSDVEITGTSLSLIGTEKLEGAMPGVDFEVGRRVTSLGNLWVYAGYYIFDDPDFEMIDGPRLRTEWRLDTSGLVRGSRLALGGEWQTDSVRGSQAFFTVQFRIPLGGTTTQRTAMHRDMGWRYWAMQLPVRRDVDIVTGQQERTVTTPAVNVQTGKAIEHIYFASPDGAAGGDGSEDDPFDLDTAVAKAANNTIIVMLGNDDEDAMETDGILLSSGATIVGGGSTFDVGTQLGMTVEDDDLESVSVTMPGTSGTITGVGDYVFRLRRNAEGVTIADLIIEGGNEASVFGRENSKVVLSSLTINEPGGRGIDLKGATDLSINEVTIDEAADLAVSLSDVSGDVFVGNIEITDANNGGMVLDQISGDITMGNLTIGTLSGDGLVITDSSDLDIAGTNTIDASDGAALRATDSDFDSAEFESLSAADAGDFGVLLDNVSGTFSVTDAITVDAVSGTGVAIRNISENKTQITLSSINVNNAGEDGVLIDNITGRRVSLSLGAINLDDADAYGVRLQNITGARTTVSLSTVTTNDTELAGVVVDGFNSIKGTLSLGAISVTDVDDDHGVRITDNSGELSFSGITVSEAGRSGVYIADISADDTTLTTGSISVSNADVDGVVVTGITGNDVTVETGNVTVSDSQRGLVIADNDAEDLEMIFGSVTLTSLHDDGVVIDGLAGNDVRLDIGNVVASDMDAAAVNVVDVAADDLRITMDNITASDVTNGLLVADITTDGTRLTIGDIKVSDASGTAVLITGPSGNEVRITLDNLDFDDGSEGLRVTSAAGSDFQLNIGDIDANNVNGDAVIILGATGDDSVFDLGDLNFSDVGRGLVLSGDFGAGSEFTVGASDMQDVDDQGIAVLDLDGSDLTLGFGNVTMEDTGSDAILISNFLASDSALTMKDINIDTPGNDGVLIDGVSGDNVDMNFGDTTVKDPVNEGVEQLNITGSNVDIDFDSIEVD